MKFSFNNTDVYISFTFIAVSVFMLTGENGSLYFIALISSLFHESVHIMSMYLFGVSVHSVSLSIFGGNILREHNTDNHLKEAIINLSAPIINIVIGVVFIFLSNKAAGFVNLLIGIFNLFPFYNFDGGTGLWNILRIRYSSSSADRVIFITSTGTIAVFSVLNFILCKTQNVNYLFIVINIYMIAYFLANIFKKGEDKV